MAVRLSEGAIKEIFNGKEEENLVLQLLDSKLIQSTAHDRYRMLISDGKYKTGCAMLGTQLNDLIGKDLNKFAVFRVDRYVCNTVQDAKKVLIILDLTVMMTADIVGSTIGNPVSYDPSNKSNELTDTGNDRVASGAVTTNGFAGKMSNQGPKQSASAGIGASSSKSGSSVGSHPIASLTPYQNRWTICARVTNKSDIRHWSNSRGQGKLFSMDLLDNSGEIKATAFNEQCDKFFNLVEVNKVYYITQAQLKTANKQYSSLKNDYEMSLNQGTQLWLCEEQASDIPTMQFEFVSINQIEKAEKETVIDVIGVCKQTDDISIVTQKTTGKELKKRDLIIVDDSCCEIRITLWGTQAENFDGSLNPIVAAKGVKVSDYNGKSLSVLSSSAVQINPDIKESHKLRAWYENNGVNMQTSNLSNQKGSSGGAFGSFKTLGEASLEKLGCKDTADYYSTVAMPILIRKENCLYPACPSDGCNKKVIDQGNQVYRCEKCNKEYETFNWRMMLSVNIADCTENTWVTLFQDQAEHLLKCDSNDLASKKENDEKEFHAIINAATFKEFIFRLRVKMESYNDEKRIKTSVVAIQDLDPIEHSKKLIQEIKNVAGMA